MRRTAALLALFALVALAAPACHEPVAEGEDGTENGGEPDGAAILPANTHGPSDGDAAPLPPVAPEVAPAPTPRRAELRSEARLRAAIPTYFERTPGRRIHLRTDKPLYQPGETIWVSSFDLAARGLDGSIAGAMDATLELVSPKGAVVISQRLRREGGRAAADLLLPPDVQGGEYTVRLTAADGVAEERPVVVNRYEPPRVKKKLEFVRKAYGPGDEVTATVELRRPTGEPLAGVAAEGLVRLDGEDLPRVRFSTGPDGAGLVRFRLPDAIARGDALLTVLVQDGGVPESVAKRVPIVLKRIELGFFPEGGVMVQGLPTRLYFDAKNPLGKPADVEGRVVDDRGQAVATFRTHDRGVGRVDFTPAVGRTYKAVLTRPVGIAEETPLPLAEETGCTLRHYDDLDGQEEAMRVAVRCTEARDVVLAAVVGEELLDAAALAVTPSVPAVAHLRASDKAVARRAGVARITLFDADLTPLAERLVFRQRRSMLDIAVTPDRTSYVPRERVTLTVTTKDAAGRPVPADLSLAVVDDTVLSYADDKTGHILARLLLEDEIPGDVEEPNVYFDLADDKSALGLDLLLGTRGWRRFAWAPVLAPPPADSGRSGSGGWEAMQGAPRRGMRDDDDAEDKPALAAPVPAEPPLPPRAEPAAPPRADAAPPPEKQLEKPAAAPLREERWAGGDALRPVEAEEQLAAEPAMAADEALVDEDWAGGMPIAVDARARRPAPPAYAVARVFPAPTYALPHEGPRTDFRETIHWIPQLRTDERGTATVSFHLSDAVTSFRVVTEGVGGGAAGRDEAVVAARLPFSMAVKLPVAVSEGDRLLVPLTLTNEEDRALPVSLATSFGEGLALTAPVAPPGQLAPKARAALWHELTVAAKAGTASVRFAANAGGLQDAFERTLTIEPLGFPQRLDASGTLDREATHAVDLGAALPGTTTATLTLYPSPVATLVAGLEGILREPGGCFEQTSSSNYPNVLVLSYLQSHDAAAPDLVARTQGMLARGYGLLVGYESPQKGYEWFGRAPAHEALTAYGLLEFADMKKVYDGVDDGMMARTAAWLTSRRDGQGGFLRDAAALDSFGRASPEVTDAYVVYALARAGLLDGFSSELARQRESAQSTKDPYLLALAAGALLRAPADRALGVKATARLARLQADDGSVPGADHSITRSGGTNLLIETTALAVLAFLEAGGHDAAVRAGIGWLNDHRGGYGEWGATQATVLALEAMTRYATESRATRGAGVVSLLVDGREVAREAYEAGRRDPIVFADFGAALPPGARTIALRHTGEAALPYSLAVEHRAALPADHPDAAVQIATRLERNTLPMGQSVRLVATATNRTDGPLPMTLVRVGLPGGLSAQTWQLKELREAKQIAFFETRAREVVLYLDGMAPGEVRALPLDLKADVAGTYTGPASAAYLYYTNDERTWAPGLQVQIAR